MTLATSLLAAFISPTLFFGGAAAISAPILIHLLSRRRFKRIRWAAMEFLMHAQRRNRRRVRMEEWILLALRCLAVLLLSFMIARPFLQAGNAAAFLGGSRRTERVFVLDDSLSMSYQTAEGTPFDKGKLAIKRLLDTIRRESPDDTVTLLRTSSPESPVEAGTFLDDRQTDDLLSRLDALNPTQQAMDPSNAIEGVVDVLRQSPDVTSAAVYLISDFQKQDWSGDANRDSASESASESAQLGILDPLKDWANEDRGLRLVLVNVGEDDAANLAMADLTLVGGKLVAGATGTVRAKIANYSERPQEDLELQLRVGNLDQPSKTLPLLGAWQHSTVDINLDFMRPGFEAVQIELPPDGLLEDNTRYEAVDVASAIRVLIVNGEPSDDDYDNEVTFLETALRPEGDVFSGNEAVVIDETELDESNLTVFHAVILANVYRISEPAIEQLETFVRRGGGLLVFLGDQVDADLYNAALFRDGEGLLPGELTEIVRAPEASHLIVSDRLHPAMRGLSREGDPLGIGQIPFFEYFGCKLLEQGSETGEITGQSATTAPMPSTNQAARVVARFDDAEQHPAMIEKSFGRGRVTLITTAADKEWHHWPDHPTFLPVMMELIQHSASHDSVTRDQWVGQTVELALDPGIFEADAVVRTPAYPDENEVPVTAVASDDGRGMVLQWEHTDRTGLYQFLLRKREGGEAIRLIAVNTDPRESDLTMAEEADLRRSLGSLSFEYIKGIDQLGSESSEARSEFWQLAWVGVVLALMTEQILAFTWGRRR